MTVPKVVRQTLTWCLIVCGVINHAAAQPAGFNYDEEKVPEFTLPPLLQLQDGTSVTTVEQWAFRRSEILQLFRDHVFGHPPELDVLVKWQVVSEDLVFDGQTRRRQFQVRLCTDSDHVSVDLLVYTPAASEGPVPCFLGLNFNGNHTLERDPRLRIADSWVRNDAGRGNIDHQATEKTRGTSASRWPARLITERGFGLATAYYGDIDPDFDDGFENGIHRLFGGNEKRHDASGGSIAAWAWGLSRLLDVLEADPLVDGERVAVFGHSRLGKTSLWAGAEDPRFAMVISNNSGCGGAALSRRHFGETVQRINTVFPHWFCLRHRTYNENEEALPVDHHQLLALAAPRPLYAASAVEDRWADPRGEYLSLYHASPAYELLGRSGLKSARSPAVDAPVQQDVGYHIRSGKHDVKEFDWQQYLSFAEEHLLAGE